MNKRELLSRVQRYMGPGTTRSTASAALEAVLSGIAELTKQPGDRLQLVRFGTFERRLCPTRRAYSIPAGGMQVVPEHSRLCFVPAKGFPQKG